MRFLPASLKGQLMLLTLVALLLSQLASFLFILDDQKSRMKHEWFRSLLTRIATVKDVVETTPTEYHSKIIKSVNTRALRFAIEPKPSTSQSEDLLSESMQQEIERAFGELSGQVQLAFFTSLSEESQLELLFGDLWRDTKRTLFRKSSLLPTPPMRPSYAHVSVPLQSGEWLNVVVMPRGLAPPAPPLLIQFATMAAISALGIVIVLGRLTRPLKELARAASALGRGETSAKLDEKGPREIVETIHAFNEMQERLTTFVHDRAKMLAALGHDLRTPITSLRLRAEFIEDEEVREPILQTLDEMIEMAESSLSFAREEAAQEETRLVDVGALTASVCADLADTGLAVTCADTGSFAIRCRPVGMKRALRNIIENAVAYGERARVSAQCKEGCASIVVDDDGPGIPERDLEKVFKPFFRLEQSRNKDTGGVGLGLAIARSIIRSQGGEIALQNRPGGGLRVTVSLGGATVLDGPQAPSPASPGEFLDRPLGAA
ncbi:MAG: ATP-binding protein [Rhodomicrobium sp.]